MIPYNKRQDAQIVKIKDYINGKGKYVTGEGTSITLENTINTPFNNIILKGNTTQNGTPTPENPVNIRVVTGEQNVEVCGKNLLNSSKVVTGTKNGITLSYDKDTQIFTINGTCTTDNTLFELYDTYQIHYKTTKFIAYYISGSVNANVFFRLFQRDFSNNISLNLTNLSNTNKSIMRIAPTDFVAHSGQNSLRTDNGTTADNFKFKLMLTDSDDTEWEPYQGSTYPISLGNIELCKIGDYQDYFYQSGSKWYLHKEVGKVVLDGSEGWRLDGTLTNTLRMALDNTNMTPNALSNNFTYLAQYNTDSEHFYITNAKALMTFILKTTASDLANYKTWLASNNVTLYYALETATNTEITNTTLISQLDALEQAVSYDDITNISQTNANLPFIINAEAVKKLL